MYLSVHLIFIILFVPPVQVVWMHITIYHRLLLYTCPCMYCVSLYLSLPIRLTVDPYFPISPYLWLTPVPVNHFFCSCTCLFINFLPIPLCRSISCYSLSLCYAVSTLVCVYLFVSFHISMYLSVSLNQPLCINLLLHIWPCAYVRFPSSFHLFFVYPSTYLLISISL